MESERALRRCADAAAEAGLYRNSQRVLKPADIWALKAACGLKLDLPPQATKAVVSRKVAEAPKPKVMAAVKSTFQELDTAAPHDIDARALAFVEAFMMKD